MSNKNLNDLAWEKLFDKYDVLQKIETDDCFYISAEKIKEFREPRLMAKFDHEINLPKVFSDNQLAILPITRGEYVISHFEAYNSFEGNDSPIVKCSLPPYLQSLNCDDITSEAIALNCALASGIISDFVEDENILATVSGRMSSGEFCFNINNVKSKKLHRINVSNSQIEIDAGYEGVSCLALFEAKLDLSEDFLVRQLYYPFRTWQNRITKPVKTIFFVCSNGIFRLFEYKFEDIFNYNSLRLVKQKNYSLENTLISLQDVQEILERVMVVNEPKIPFPQADNFERVINICELLNNHSLNKQTVTERYAFDKRQTNYYTDAARYLGLLDRVSRNGDTIYFLLDKGQRILKLNFKQRQLTLCESILSHKVFNEALRTYFKNGIEPSIKDVSNIMRQFGIYNVESEETFKRRASTVKGWISWIISLINE
ncbi:MAG: hypothetical protein IJ859_01765 [Synergistaceae bacterium]|nr:hypothetical protein [Synergistaceae bacterium]